MKILLLFFLSITILTAKPIIGTVYDSFTNEPVSDVKIIINIKESVSYTDKSGRFELELGEKTHIDFIKSGYIEKHMNITLDYDSISVFLTPLSYEYNDITILGSLNKQQNLKTISQSSINENSSKSLSELLNNKLGISTSEMGEAVSRPVVNGLSGNRLSIINDGFKSKDLSSNSPDHAQAQTLNGLDKITILSGTDLVRYGSSLVGSAVQTESNFNIKSTIISNSNLVSGTFASVNNKFSISTKNQFSDILNGFVLDGVYTKAGDVSSPEGVLNNTDYELYEVSTGLYYQAGEFSFNPYLSTFGKKYGIPGGFVGAHPKGVDIEMQRNTMGFNSEYHTHGSVIDKLKLDYERSFYDHKEYENSGLVGAQFRFVSNSVRFELEQHQGSILKNGYIGLQLTKKDNELGGFVFIPNNQYTLMSAYFKEDINLIENLALRYGARYDITKVDLDSPYLFQSQIVNNRDFSSFSNALSLDYNASDNLIFSFDLSLSNRAPEPEELFSNGPHLAAYSYEIGNPNLELEKSISYSLKSQYNTQDFTFGAEVFYYDYSNYITPMATADTNYSTLLPIYKQTNMAAELYGINLNSEYIFSNSLSINSNVSYTIGKESINGNNLPLIPPLAMNVALNYKLDDWYFSVNTKMATSQEKTGQFENRTDGYAVLNAEVKKNIDLGGNMLAVMLNFNNITNQVYRNHLSRIKSVYPQPGFGTELTVNYYF
ncbi:MAG: TonB-dependent receptor [Candidatus Kapaibacterium sp.]